MEWKVELNLVELDRLRNIEKNFKKETTKYEKRI